MLEFENPLEYLSEMVKIVTTVHLLDEPSPEVCSEGCSECCAQQTSVHRMVGSNCLVILSYPDVASDLSTQCLSR
jgi:hypothetical protein